VACTRALQEYGVRDIVVCDRKGAVHAGRDVGDNPAKRWLAENSNPRGVSGTLQESLAGADMFLGVSGPGLLSRADLETMNEGPIVFALANPVPEIMPEEAEGVAAVMATGRSDYPNQINNVLAFPGIFRGALDARARDISPEMMLAAARAIAASVRPDELSADYIVPSVFNRRVTRDVAREVARAAREQGLARRVPKGFTF
jgi:malate dehydrogenase (oxaloacetate-decarboxylating)